MTSEKLKYPMAAWILILVCTGLISCKPEPSSAVYSRSITGLKTPANWSSPEWYMELPPSWVSEPVFGMRDASIRIFSTNGVEGELTISRLPLTGGTLASNINRWRKQAGLDLWPEADVIQNLKKVTISGKEGYSMVFESKSEGKPSINGAIIETEQERIFIKLTGPPALIKVQQQNWVWFLGNLEMLNGR